MTRAWAAGLALCLVASTWLAAPEPLPGFIPRSGPNVPALGMPDALTAQLEADVRALAQVAMGEDPQAVEAVVWVVLNRAGCRVRPFECERPILAEIIRHRAFGTWLGDRWKPSWCPNGPAPLWAESRVLDVLLGRIPDPTRGATHFHRQGTWDPPWAPSEDGRILHGSHFFYKEV